jgi:hypothetical protein
VIDQPGSIGSLAVCVARRRGVPVAYVPGLVMRRASELYPGGGCPTICVWGRGGWVHVSVG